MRLSLCVLLAAIGCGASPGKPAVDAAGGSGQLAGAGGGASPGGRGGAAVGSGGQGGLAGTGLDAGAGAGGEVIADAGIVADAGDTGDTSPPLQPICVRDGDPSASYCDLVVQGEGLGRFEGMLVHVRNGRSPSQRLGSGQTRVVDGKFSITLPLAQELVTIYKRTTVRVDVDGDGVCGPGDQMFTSGATGFPSDGGQRSCPGIVPVNEQSTFRAVVAQDCQPSPDFCELPPDGGP
jgi:hypothetical protein